MDKLKGTAQAALDEAGIDWDAWDTSAVDNMVREPATTTIKKEEDDNDDDKSHVAEQNPSRGNNNDAAMPWWIPEGPWAIAWDPPPGFGSPPRSPDNWDRPSWLGSNSTHWFRILNNEQARPDPHAPRPGFGTPGRSTGDRRPDLRQQNEKSKVKVETPPREPRRSARLSGTSGATKPGKGTRTPLPKGRNKTHSQDEEQNQEQTDDGEHEQASDGEKRTPPPLPRRISRQDKNERKASASSPPSSPANPGARAPRQTKRKLLDEYYTVCEILDVRPDSRKKGAYEYLTSWEGYNETTWEPEEHFDELLVEQFKEELRRKGKGYKIGEKR